MSDRIYYDVNNYMRRVMGSDQRLKYHTYSHVLDVTERLPIFLDDVSLELYLAAMFHDVIYDEQPNKELRSAEQAKAFCSRYSEVDSQRVFDLIMATDGHSVKEYLHDEEAIALIKADLHSLTDPIESLRAHLDIIDESCALYDLTPYQASLECRKFMQEFSLTMRENFNLTGDRYWLKVYAGCKNTSALALMNMEYYENFGGNL